MLAYYTKARNICIMENGTLWAAELGRLVNLERQQIYRLAKAGQIPGAQWILGKRRDKSGYNRGRFLFKRCPELESWIASRNAKKNPRNRRTLPAIDKALWRLRKLKEFVSRHSIEKWAYHRRKEFEYSVEQFLVEIKAVNLKHPRRQLPA